jgi:hypothetical protein
MGILNKKAQLQIQETILVVFIFVVLILFGLVFFHRVQSASIINDFNKFELDKLKLNFITLSDLSEFSCSNFGVKESCVDTSKLVVFNTLMKDKTMNNYYFERFGYMNITIYNVYPEKNSAKCSASNLFDCGVWEVYSRKPIKVTSKIVIDSPVSLYNPEKDTYTIGILVVEAYNV